MSNTNQNIIKAIYSIREKMNDDGARIHIAVTAANGDTVIDGNDLAEILGEDYDSLCSDVAQRLKHKLLLKEFISVSGNV